MSSHLSPQQLQYFKTALNEQREELLRRLESNSSLSFNHHTNEYTHQISNSVGELSHMDNHFADHATELFEKERDIAFYQAQLRTLNSLEDALSRIEEGIYGTCSVCHKPIALERLHAVPETATCEAHSPHIEASLANYEFQVKDFQDFNNDNKDQTFYDGEDTLQDLLESGNSSYAEDPRMMLDSEFAEEFANELEGFCEPLESFIATDITGTDVFIVRNQAYMQYMNKNEGDLELEKIVHDEFTNELALTDQELEEDQDDQ